MAIAIDSSSPDVVDNFVDPTTGTFTAPAGSLLVACGGAATLEAVSISNTGPALAWTQQVQFGSGDTGANNGQAAIWTAPVDVEAARTVTLGVASGGAGLKVLVITGADINNPVGATGHGAATTNTLTPTVYTSTVPKSRGVIVANDWTARGLPAVSADLGYPGDNLDGDSGIAIAKAADTPDAGTNVSVDINGAGTNTIQWNWVAVEILPPSQLRPRPLIANQAALVRASYW